jgi:hypothetical protein
MAEDREQPRPQGDPLRRPLSRTVQEERTGDDNTPHPLRDVGEENRAQQQSDAPPDASIELGRGEIVQETDRDNGRGSTANGIPAFDEAAGQKRRRQYAEGASLVSETD